MFSLVNSAVNMSLSVFAAERRAAVQCCGAVAAIDTIRYDTRCYFNVRSKADISRLNLPHGNDN